MEQTTLSKYVKAMRKQYNLTQMELSEKSGVGLRFLRELEQGKQTLRLDKVCRRHRRKAPRAKPFDKLRDRIVFCLGFLR